MFSKEKRIKELVELKPQEILMNNYTHRLIKALAINYCTSESAIVDAALNAFNEQFLKELAKEIKGDMSGVNRPFINNALKNEALHDTLS